MKTVTVSELRKNVRKYIDCVEDGERVRIIRHGKLIAEIQPVNGGRSASWRKPGLRLRIPGVSLSRALLEERRESKR